ncbi:MAG: hypothetical protein ACYDCF_10815 [Burkholderiales bacterium]
MDIWTVLLSSTLVSGIVSALVGGWFSLRSKQNEYTNMYYKMVLERRLAAYDEVEGLIAAIKIVVIDDDQKPYHLLFSQDDDHVNVYKTLVGIMPSALWLTDDLFELMTQLNRLVYTGTPGDSGFIEFGKKNYTVVADLRAKLERLHARDMLSLHDVPAFLKSKKPADGYATLPSRG